MTCLDFENRVQKLLDLRQRELPAELSVHISYCAACRETWESFERLQDAVVLWRAQLPAVGQADEVLHRLRIELETTLPERVLRTHSMKLPMSSSPPQRHSALAGLMSLFAAAMALLIAVGFGWRISGNVTLAKKPGVPQSLISANSLHRSEGGVASERPGDRRLDVLLHDARDAYVALASQAWQQVSTADMLLPQADTASPFGNAELTPGVPEPLSRPLAPLGKELRDAVDAWFQQILNTQDSQT